MGLSDQDIVHLTADSDASLAALYIGATAFVYPSLYEGFGIPVLEAMTLGCPVLCSDSSSLPEVAGDAAEYFDPARTDSLRAALESVVGSATRRAELASRGRARAALFSWERCARETLAVYRSVV
jgi:glycosyltransferase involved in cell wall biosynthesis